MFDHMFPGSGGIVKVEERGRGGTKRKSPVCQLTRKVFIVREGAGYEAAFRLGEFL